MSLPINFAPHFIAFCYFALTLIGFGLLIFIHELGHYLVARRCKMRVEEFNIGFGRPLFSKKIDGVMWRLRWLPFGGYVRIAGMEDDPAKPSAPHTYYGSSLLARAQVIVAGPLFNIAGAFLIFCCVYAFGGASVSLQQVSPYIGYLDESSELYQKGLRAGDRLISLDELPFFEANDKSLTRSSTDVEFELKAKRIDCATGKSSTIAFRINLPKDAKSERKSLNSCGAQALQIKEISPGSPLEKADLKPGDRLLWADGERLFSREQLQKNLNDNRALITVQRRDKTHSIRVPKIDLRTLRTRASATFCRDWLNWHGEGKTARERELMCVPFSLRKNNAVQSAVEIASRSSGDQRASRDGDIALLAGDRILAIDGCPVTSPRQIAALLQTKHLVLLIERPSGFLQKGQKPIDLATALKVFAGPLESPDLIALEKQVGSGASKAGTLILLKPIEVPQRALEEGGQNCRLNIEISDVQIRLNRSPFKKLLLGMTEPLRALKGLAKGTVKTRHLAGPIGMVQIAYRQWSDSAIRALDFLALISLNLAVINLLPLPVLDGGHLLFALLEYLRGKPLSAETMQRLTTAFFVLFAALGLLIAYQDIVRIISKRFLRF